MSAQKKRRVREKERARYARRKASKTPSTLAVFSTASTVASTEASPTMASSNSPDAITSTPPQSLTLLSASAMKQRAYLVKKEMPKSPDKFAQVMGHIIMNATPRKKNFLRKVGISNSPKKNHELYSKSIIETMAKIKEKRQESWLAVKLCLVASMKSTNKAKNFKKMSEDTGLSYRFLKKYTTSEVNDLTKLHRKKRQDCLNNEIIEKVHDHFETSASYVPDKKAVCKKGVGQTSHKSVR